MLNDPLWLGHRAWSGPEPLSVPVFFLYTPAEESDDVPLQLAPDRPQPDADACGIEPDEVRSIRVQLRSACADNSTPESRTSALRAVMRFVDEHHATWLGRCAARTDLEALRCRSSAADDAWRTASAAVRLAGQVYCNAPDRILARFLDSVQAHAMDEAPGSPAFSALFDRALHGARLEMIAGTAVSRRVDGTNTPGEQSEAERYYSLQDKDAKDRNAASAARGVLRGLERFGPVRSEGTALLEETAEALIDWTRCEFRFAARFASPMLTELDDLRTRAASLASLESDVNRLMTEAAFLAAKLVNGQTPHDLSESERRLCSRLIDRSIRHVHAAIDEEVVRRAERQRSLLDELSLLQKQFARSSSHPSVLFARDEDERQAAAFFLAAARLEEAETA